MSNYILLIVDTYNEKEIEVINIISMKYNSFFIGVIKKLLKVNPYCHIIINYE